jgi:hypothetical protein
MGTTPIVSLGKVRVLSGKINSTMAMIKSRVPPAILKSETEIPSRAKTHFPAPRNQTLTRKAVRVDWRITLLRSDFSISEVNEKKMGRTPKASKATKRGMKGRKISKDVICFKRLSSRPMKIIYKKERNETRTFL